MKTKSILSFLLFIFCGSTLFAQASDWLWSENTINGSSISAGTGESVCADALGNVYATGYFYNSTITFGSFTLTNTSASGYTADIFIVKYDANGNVIWARSGTGPGENCAYFISSDDSGNVYITGFFSGPLTFGSILLTNAGHGDFFIAKYDTNGNAIWAHRVGGIADDWGAGVSTDANGNVFVTGFFASPTLVFGSTTLTNADPSTHTNDIFIAKYDANGNVLWAKSAGGVEDDQCNSVSVDGNGNAIITGCYRSLSITFGSTTLTNCTNSNDYTFFITKYDIGGNVIWAKGATTASNGESEGKSVSADASGNLFVTGKFFSPTIVFDTTTLTDVGNVDVFVVKYDANGNLLWARDGGGLSYDVGLSISASTAGNVFVTGRFHSDSVTFGSTVIAQPAGSTDPMFLVKYDANGNVLCTSALGSSLNHESSNLGTDLFGNAYVTGEFATNTLIVGSDTLTLTGVTDVFVAKYNCENTESVAELNNEETFSIFPNPSNGIFTLNSEIQKGDIFIYNMLGEIVYQSKLNSSTVTIDLSEQASGIYFVNLKTEKESFTKKIIVQ